MEKQPEPKTEPKGLIQWAMTPPQSYAVYAICVVLVGGMSFFAGSLRPKKTANFGPPPISAPRN